MTAKIVSIYDYPPNTRAPEVRSEPATIYILPSIPIERNHRAMPRPTGTLARRLRELKKKYDERTDP